MINKYPGENGILELFSRSVYLYMFVIDNNVCPYLARVVMKYRDLDENLNRYRYEYKNIYIKVADFLYRIHNYPNVVVGSNSEGVCGKLEDVEDVEESIPTSLSDLPPMRPQMKILSSCQNPSFPKKPRSTDKPIKLYLQYHQLTTATVTGDLRSQGIVIGNGSQIN
ncbi:hypothetical protein KUTeg_003885 [Tegillarca granosa]|uniref:Uncharacterized protein n=1 Tax=Tegillarca granosa TaxID=220873 RepID=A0ABQ9FNB5_TEGGR|nr:hypothetical protein KUTeg_003885 [Tegillarca granosa]